MQTETTFPVYTVPPHIAATIPGISIRKTAAGFFATRSAMFEEGFAGRFAPSAEYEVTATGRVSTAECIEWSGARNHQGYGKKWRNGKTVSAHRVAWEETFGPIPEGLSCLHRCDTPSCVNVEHLFLGTRQDNNRDKTRKGRSSKPTTKLTPRDVVEIRSLLESGTTHREIASRFGISQMMVSYINTGRSWRDAT